MQNAEPYGYIEDSIVTKAVQARHCHEHHYLGAHLITLTVPAQRRDIMCDLLAA